VALGYSSQIRERILSATEGTVFVNSDFADIADTETIRRILNRLTQAGTLRSIMKGVYEKPEYSEMLNEYVATDPNAVA
jgi:predicted transcriptional regulator of viral defense system